MVDTGELQLETAFEFRLNIAVFYARKSKDYMYSKFKKFQEQLRCHLV